MGFGNTLARLREAAGLTQVELANKASVPIDTLRRWEQGRNLPRVDDAGRLAHALGVSIAELLLDSDLLPVDTAPAVKVDRPRKEPPPQPAPTDKPTPPKKPEPSPKAKPKKKGK